MLIRALRPRHSRDAAEGMEENSRRKTTPDDVEPRGYQNKGAVRLAEGLWWRRRPMVVTRTMKDQISSDLDRTPAVPEIECVEESECWCYRARAVDVELSAWAHRAVQCRLLPFVAESVLGDCRITNLSLFVNCKRQNCNRQSDAQVLIGRRSLVRPNASGLYNIKWIWCNLSRRRLRSGYQNSSRRRSPSLTSSGSL
ncbi:hypothetical protein T11_1760 [Trichinella zimbabwensis]|uniref:Uncharacterized protein n=1 Tax=Trichinella zimbabwensis TaxID=268475 RepID=A0A0V1GWK4_9BILA|nr:hypothetical protein T11_1760 [Trichinella zimbabwensis]